MRRSTPLRTKRRRPAGAPSPRDPRDPSTPSSSIAWARRATDGTCTGDAPRRTTKPWRRTRNVKNSLHGSRRPWSTTRLGYRAGNASDTKRHSNTSRRWTDLWRRRSATATSSATWNGATRRWAISPPRMNASGRLPRSQSPCVRRTCAGSPCTDTNDAAGTRGAR